jgi:hypothetical protein
VALGAVGFVPRTSLHAFEIFATTWRLDLTFVVEG